MKLVLAIIGLAVLFQVVVSQRQCALNEEWSNCMAAKHCQEACDWKVEYCIPQCVPGCICIDGFVRRSILNWWCVPEHECRP